MRRALALALLVVSVPLLQAFRALHGIKADVFVAQHGSVFALEDKARRAEALSQQ